MSWLFGLDKHQAPMAPPPTAGGSGASEPPAPGSKEEAKRMAYSFDSSALERAAKAAHDLEKSPHAKQALALANEQEKTRQMEHQAHIKEIEVGIEHEKTEQRRVAEVERRKTLEEEAKHARARIDYQQQLERKRKEEEMGQQRALQMEQLKAQEESVKKQETMRRQTVEHELSLKHKYDMERVGAEAAARGKSDRENRDVHLEQLRAKESERRTTILESIKTGGAVVGAGLHAFIDDKQKVLAAAGGISLLALGVYSAKRGTAVGARYIESRMGKPSLVRETSRLTPVEVVKHPIRTIKQLTAKSVDPMEGVVLAPSLEERVRDIALTTRNTKKNNGLYRNVLFYGPPGTGKTMFAKRLAAHSGLDYAILTGGDVAPMGKDGVTAIHSVFDWAATSRKGLLLFIDEGDAFLRKRSMDNMSEDLRSMLNAFLYRTGEQSNRFMLCVATNQPEQFDWAVNDRLDEMVHFDLPGLKERERMLLVYFQQYIADAATGGNRTSRLKLDDFDWIGTCKDVAQQVEGLSGREISKLVVSWQASAYASEDGVLTRAMMDQRVKETMKQHAQKMEWLARERRQLAALDHETSMKAGMANAGMQFEADAASTTAEVKKPTATEKK